MAYRLGIDIGTNSLGWCLLELDEKGEPVGIRDIGVRLFSDGRDPQSGTSLAVDRRDARGARRRRDRYLLRRKDLMVALIRFGLMPEDAGARKSLEKLDPYELRARGLDEALTRHEIGRAIFHLNQRRGFRSNRRTDKAGKADDKDPGKIRSAGDRLAGQIAATGARTVGEYLWNRHRRRDPVRARLRGEGAKAEYDFYPQRAMLEDEFRTLWQAQARHHPELAEDMCDELFAILFRQRPLKPVDPGKCTLDPARDKDDLGGMRAPWALPLTQRFRIYQELANLRITCIGVPERELTREERDAVARELFRKRKVTFKAMRRLLKMEAENGFNLESEKRKDLKGDETAAVLAHKGGFGTAWHKLDDDRQAGIVERLLAEEDEETLIAWLESECGLDRDAAAAVAGARLAEGYCRLGRRALARMVPVLRDQGLGYADAAEECGYHHSDHRPDDVLDSLPYYGEALERHVSGTGDPDDAVEDRLGRLANPTVHIGLNQTRRLVNALIEQYGPPAEIVVELARELKQSQREKKRIQKEQAENQKKNDERRARLTAFDLRDSGENRLRLRLWEELNPGDSLDRRCVYTGEKIGIRRLLSDEIEIEHILPFSRTLDNSPANKTVSLRAANRVKGDRSPFEAFGSGPDWEEILVRSQALPRNKRWRFQPDAMERFEKEERTFLDRQLTDTAYLSRIAREYLTHVCPANKVWAVPGRLTAMLRGLWGLNSLLSDANLKNRVDHRHHAVDAVVAAVTDRGLLQRIATAAARSGERFIADMPEPWPGFRDNVRDALAQIVVSHKLDRGTAGRLHEDTAYGLIAEPDREDGFNLVFRKPLTALNANEVARIRDRDLRQRVLDRLAAAGADGVAHKQALADFSRETGVRRVRLLRKEAGVIRIAGPDGRPYKAYIPGDNHHIDIFVLPDGGWAAEAVTVFQANRPHHALRWRQEHPNAPLVMRVHKGDFLKLNRNGEEQIMRIVRLEITARRLRLAGHLEGGDLQKRHDDPDDPFRWTFASFSRLREWQTRKVSVDVTGRVRDPGFRP